MNGFFIRKIIFYVYVNFSIVRFSNHQYFLSCFFKSLFTLFKIFKLSKIERDRFLFSDSQRERKNVLTLTFIKLETKAMYFLFTNEKNTLFITIFWIFFKQNFFQLNKPRELNKHEYFFLFNNTQFFNKGKLFLFF